MKTFDLKRTLLHMPVGALSAWLITQDPIYGPVASVIFTFMFWRYEFNEDMRIRDHAFLDISGWLWGFAVTIVIIFAIVD